VQAPLGTCRVSSTAAAGRRPPAATRTRAPTRAAREDGESRRAAMAVGRNVTNGAAQEVSSGDCVSPKWKLEI
jgi:hypothetical protein